MIEVHLMTSELDAGSGDDYEHKHDTFIFADGDVRNCRYHRTACMHRRLYQLFIDIKVSRIWLDNGNTTFKLKSFFKL